MKVTQPDISFIKEVNRDTGSSLKSCMQCGTCSVVCDLSPDDKPYPRKEMFWAGWGQKEKLMGDPDVWLCHQCGDCTTYCPRGVRPGDVLASIRKISYYHFAKPKFLGTILKKPAFLPLVIALPIVFLLIVLLIAGTLKTPEGEINYSLYFPHSYINISFSFLLILVIWGMVLSIRNYWRALSKNITNTENKNSLFKVTFSVFREIFVHENFKKCTTQRYRYPAHFLLFWGFVLLIVTTILAIVNVLFFEYPLPIWHPVKILGNLSGIIFLAGCFLLLLQRIRNRKTNNIYNYPDWMFLITLVLVGLTGFLTEGGRSHGWSFSYEIYFIHLLFNWILIIYLPYTKFSHIIYRIVATIHSKYYRR